MDNSNDFNQQEIKNFASWLLSLSPFEFTTLGVIVGYILALSLTSDEQASVGNWFELVGQIMLTFNAQGSNDQSPSYSQYYDLVKKVNDLENQLNNLKKH